MTLAGPFPCPFLPSPFPVSQPGNSPLGPGEPAAIPPKIPALDPCVLFPMACAIKRVVDICTPKSGVSEEDEAECFAKYEQELDECKAYRLANGARWYANCKTNTFNRYQTCRGF